MLGPRWKKLFRDILLTRGRITMMVIAIGVSLLGLGAVLSAYAILTREITRNYLSTNPASATIEIDRSDAALLQAAQSLPWISALEARASVLSRVQLEAGVWQPLLLFVVKDFTALRVATFEPDSGAWPPPKGSVLLERTALDLFGRRLGDTVTVKTPGGPNQQLRISGTVHDPSLAPAWQERMGYGYISLDTMEWLGEQGNLNELKIIVKDNPFDPASVTQQTLEVAGWLKTQGHQVEEIQIPPPGRHPHQNQMVAILVLLFTFSILSLILSAILVAALIAGMMAKEVRQIGVMKAIGASSWQIKRLYIGLILFIGTAALIPGSILGSLAGKALAATVAKLLNFTLYSNSIPWWVILVQICAGLVIPLLIAMIPLARIRRMTIREALNDFGVSQKLLSGGWLQPVLVLLGKLDRILLIILRNTFRRRGRFLLTLGLLAAGGGLFMTALNINSAWERTLFAAFNTRHYDFEIRLSQPVAASDVEQLTAGISGIKKVEVWGFTAASQTQPDGFEITHVYPDGGHGSFSLRGVPAGSSLVEFPLLKGRWLQADDTDAVVLNQTAWSLFPALKLGDRLPLTVNGRQTSWRVTGMVREIGPASAYVAEEAFERIVTQPGYAQSLRIVTEDKTLQAREDVIRKVDRALGEANINVSMVIADAEFRNAITDHIFILIFSLVAMAVMMGIVGLLGLTSTMSTNTIERTREFGVMRAIGGTPAVILRSIIGESVFIGLLSMLGALALSLPLSYFVGQMLGNLAFKTPLSLTFSTWGILLWSGIISVGAAAASAYPAWWASRLAVRETLVYE